MKLSVKLCVLFLLPYFLAAQHRFEHIDIEDGLTENAITDIFQDSEGYLWFSTQDGLSQYDGYQFKNYNVSLDDSSSLSDNFLWSILEDSLGYIWSCSRNGINRIDKKTGKCTRFFHNFSGISNSSNEVNDIAIYNGELYCYLYIGIYKISIQDEYPARDNLIETLVNDLNGVSPIGGFVEDKKNKRLYGVVVEGLIDVINGLTIRSSIFEQEDKSKFQRGIQSDSGDLWMNSSRNVYHVNYEKDSLLPFWYDFKGAHIFRVSSIQDQLWVGTNRGLYIFSKEGQLERHVVNNERRANSLSNNAVTAILEDHQGKVWLGTASSGINLYDPGKDRFQFLAEETFGGKYYVRSTFQDKNRLLVGTTNGLYLIRLKSEDLIIPSDFLSDQVESIEKLEFPGFSKLNIGAINKGFGNDILLGNGDHILVLDEEFKLKETVATKAKLPHTNSTSKIIKTSSNELWIASHHGVFVLDSAYQLNRVYYDDDAGLETSYFLTVFEDNEGSIWLGSNFAVYQYLPEENTFENFSHDKNKPDESPAFVFVSGFEDFGDEYLWIATYGGGLSRMHKKTHHFVHFNMGDGLINNVCNGIVKDEEGNIWLNTNKGIAKFNTHTETFSNYTRQDGLYLDEFNLGSYYQNALGDIFFGTGKGLVAFDPSQIENASYEPNLLINKLEINYKEATERLIEGRIDLYPEDKTVTIHFVGMNFSKSDKIKYKFQLSGYNEEWIETKSLLTSFPSLSDGEYTFKLNVTNEDGVWNSTPLETKFIVHPPFYKTLWFISISSILLISLSILIIRYFAQRKIKKQLRAMEIEQAVYQEKQRISRDLHDNIGSQITYLISSIDEESYKREEQDFFDQLGDKARTMMTQLRQTIWLINKEKIRLNDFIEKIRDYALKVCTATSISPMVEADESENPQLSPTTVSHLFRIVQEALNNAIKHSGADQIKISIRIVDSHLELNILDNGKGIKQLEEKQGHYGLKNMRDRVKELKGEFMFSNQEGLSIEIRIPL